MNEDEKVTYFAETDARNKRIKFGIKSKDRSRHMYAIGKTGMGKSTLLENLAVQDIMAGNGFAFIDPHGKSADYLLDYIPKERMNDVVYFAPFDMEHPISFNVMEDVGAERRHLVSSGLMSAFKKIWVDAWSARMEYILGNIMLALLEYPGSTLIGINRMLSDKDFRKKVVDNITDPSVRSFWVDEYAKYTDKFAAEAAPAIQNKVGQFVANPLVRNIIGQPKSSFDLRKIMDEKKILIINLSKGRVGESNANLLGSMLITKIYLAAMSRADLNEKELKKAPQFYLYVDEFQSFANESFADILSEARKYKLNLIMAHQYIEQMSEEVRAAVFGNVGTMCVFRVGAYDAEVLEKEFAPAFTAEDIVNLQQYQMYLKLMIDQVTSPPFSASGMNPIEKPAISYVKEIIDASRANFTRPRIDVEDEIKRWHEKDMGESYQGGGQARVQSGSTSAGASQGGSSTGMTPRRAEASPSSPRKQVVDDRVDTRPNPPPKPAGGLLSASGSPVRRDTNPSGRSSAPAIDRRPNPAPISSSASVAVRPTPAQITKAEGVARENDLRKAISLSYLKSEPEAVKNDQKQARPENVAALREALLSVMKDSISDSEVAKAASEAQQKISAQAAPAPVPTPPLQSRPEQSQPVQPQVQPVVAAQPQTFQSQAQPIVVEEPKVEPVPPPRAPHQKSKPSEVPEETLKDIFNVLE